MNDPTAFFHFEKAPGRIRLTLGSSFAKTLVALTVIASLAFAGSAAGVVRAVDLRAFAEVLLRVLR